MERVLIVNA
ncbi:hypothetical protein ACH54_15500, partial [Salmonella enterica subsp. enterica serovar Infantis]